MEDEIYKLIGDKISANDGIKLSEIMAGYYLRASFTDEVRIQIHKYAVQVGGKYSGAQFTEFLNGIIAPELKINYRKRF